MQTTEPTTETQDQSTNANDDIARLAYYYYVERGRMDGHPEQDWHRAEQYLRNLQAGHHSIVPNGA